MNGLGGSGAMVGTWTKTRMNSAEQEKSASWRISHGTLPQK